MELKLDIYNGKEIEKTYTSTDFLLMTGTCEDIISVIDIDKIGSLSADDEAMYMEILKVVAKSFSSFRPLLQDVFEGLTEEEYRRTAIKDVGNVIFQIVAYTIGELFSVSSKKN